MCSSIPYFSKYQSVAQSRNTVLDIFIPHIQSVPKSHNLNSSYIYFSPSATKQAQAVISFHLNYNKPLAVLYTVILSPLISFS